MYKLRRKGASGSRMESCVHRDTQIKENPNDRETKERGELRARLHSELPTCEKEL